MHLIHIRLPNFPEKMLNQQTILNGLLNDTHKLYNFSFIRLADYLIVNTMHVLAVNSVSTLLNFLKEQLATTPSLAEIQGWNKEEEETEDADSKAPDDDAKVWF